MKFAKLIGGGQPGGRLRNLLGSVAVFVALVGGRYALRSWLREDAPPPPPAGAAMPAPSTPNTAGVAAAAAQPPAGSAKQAPDAKAKPAAKGAPAPAAAKGAAKPAETEAASKTADAAKTVSVPSQPAPKPAAPAPKPAAAPAAPAAVAKAPAPAAAKPAPAAPAKATTTQTVATPRQGASPEAASATIQREVFSYDPGRRRDPFVSLAKPSEVGPLLAELKLIGIAFDEVGRNSVAVLRDQGKGLYRVKIGQSVGRARVATIGRRSVTFNVDEFGVTRQEVMTLRDTTKKGM